MYLKLLCIRALCITSFERMISGIKKRFSIDYRGRKKSALNTTDMQITVYKMKRIASYDFMEWNQPINSSHNNLNLSLWIQS